MSFRDLVALTKPRLSGLVVFTAGGGLLLAPRSMHWFSGLMSVLATAILVGAANALNGYLERDRDQLMERTRTRPLPTGRLDPRAALVLAIPMAALATVLLLVFANPLTACLGLLAFISYVLVYTPMKVISPLALWAGAVPGAIPPLMGWTAAQARIDRAGLTLFAIMFCWQITHFLAIGVYRKHDYARAGFRILPLVAPASVVRFHSILWSALLVPVTFLLGPLGVIHAAAAWISAAMSLAFTAQVVWSTFRERNESAGAWRVFRGSLLYLTALFIVMGVGAR